MPLKDAARSLKAAVVDGLVPRERLRRAYPQAHIDGRVLVRGDLSRIRLADGVSIWGPTVLYALDGGGLTGARLEIGERTYIGEFNNLRCAGAPIVIGRDCLISQHITIVGSNHGTAPGTPIVDQPWSGDGVVIGDGVWVGANVTILPGARIGDGAVVAAGSVVRGEVPAGAIVGGTPARVIGERR